MLRKTLFAKGGVRLGLMEPSGARKQRLWEKNFTPPPPKNYTLW